jgi:SAM-dependent methyltransferase
LSKKEQRPEQRLSARAQLALVECAEGRLPPNIAAMHLIMEEADLAVLDRAMAEAGSAQVAQRLRQVRLLAAGPAGEVVRRTAALLDHDAAAAQTEDAVARWTAAFDRAAAAHPEAGVALYALGDADLLERATHEIADALYDWGLLGSDRRVLDLGCGIGRMLPALAQHCAHVVGLDISERMLAEAKQRCALLPNLFLLRGSGRDLALFRDRSFDLVLAVDSFPYLYLSGLSETLFGEAVRVLAGSGAIAILNYSYRGDLAVDKSDLAQLARAHGLEMYRDGSRDFSLWDGATFLLRRINIARP